MDSQRSFLEKNPRWATLGSARSQLPPRNYKQTHKRPPMNRITAIKEPTDSAQSKQIAPLKPADPSGPTGHGKNNSDMSVIPKRVDAIRTAKTFQRAPTRVTWLRIPAFLITLALLIEIARVCLSASNRTRSSVAVGEPKSS